MVNIIIKNAKAERTETICSDGKRRASIKVIYTGNEAQVSFADAKAVYNALKAKIGGFLPHVENLEPGALYFSFEECVPINGYLRESEFDLNERVTVARRLCEYLTELQRNGYKLSCDAFDDIYIKPFPLDLFLYDLTKVKESKFSTAELNTTQKTIAKWFTEKLFAGNDGITLPQTLVEIIEKLRGITSHYRSYNGLFRDISNVSLQLKKHGKCTPFPLDSYAPVVNRIQEAISIKRQDFSCLIDAYRDAIKGKNQYTIITGKAGVGKRKLFERFANDLPADTLLFELNIESEHTQKYEGLSYIFNTILRTQILVSDSKSKIFKSFLSVRFAEDSFVVSLIDDELLNILGVCSRKEKHDHVRSDILEEIRHLNDIDFGPKVIGIHGFSLLDGESKQLLSEVIASGVLKNTFFVLTDTNVDPALLTKENAVLLTVEPLSIRDIEGIINYVFHKNRFDNVKEIAQQIFNKSRGTPALVLKIIDASVLLGYIYQGDDGCHWYCSPGFFKTKHLDERDDNDSKGISESLAKDERLVVQAIALDSFGVSFDELEFVTALPAAKLEATLVHILSVSKSVRRWNEKYIISNQDRTDILKAIPMRLRREINRRYTEYLLNNSRDLNAVDYTKRIAQHYLEEIHIGGERSFQDEECYTRAFWSAAYIHYKQSEFIESRKYIEAATERIVDDNPYDKNPELAWQLDMLEMSICEKFADIDRATDLYERVRHQCTNTLRCAEISHTFVRILKAKREFQRAFDVGYNALDALGYAFPKRFRVINSFWKYFGVSKKIDDVDTNQLCEYPETNNNAIKLVHKISAQLAVVCYQYHNLSTYVPVIVLNSLEISLEHGATVEFSLYLMGYAYIKQMFPIKNDRVKISEYYEISKRVLARFKKDEYVELFNEFINYGIIEPWGKKLDPVINTLNLRYHRAIASSEAETAGFFSGARFLLSLMNGDNVKNIENSVDAVLPEIVKLNQGTPITIHSIIKATVQELGSSESSETTDFYKFLGRTKIDNPKNYTVLFCIAYCGLMVSFVKRRHIKALGYFASGVYKYFLGASGLPYIVYFILYAYSSYSRLSICRRANVTSVTKASDILLRTISPIPLVVSRIFKKWASMYPGRYQHLFDYVQAERMLFLPFLHAEALDKFRNAFEYAVKNDYKHDALVIGSRLCELKRVYKISEIDASSIEPRLNNIAKESGIIRLIAQSDQPSILVLTSKEDLFKPYTEDNLIKACECAVSELKDIGQYKEIRIFEGRRDSIYEISRYDGKAISAIEKDVHESVPTFANSIVESARNLVDSLDIALTSETNDRIKQYQNIFIIQHDQEALGFIAIMADSPLGNDDRLWIDNVRRKLRNVFIFQRLKRERFELELDVRTNQEKISHINHEIRTPINGVVSLSNKLKEIYYENSSSEQVGTYIDYLATCANQLLRIHQDVGSLQDIDNGIMSLSLSVIDLHEAILSPFNALSEMYMKKGIELVRPQLGNLPRTAIADGAKISQVVYNLLHNSYKFTERGSVTGVVEFVVNRNKITMEILVNDTGVGISPDLARNLRKNGATTFLSPSSIKGTGVGLYLVSKICELMDGHLVISNGVDQGAKIGAIINVEVTDQQLPEKALSENDNYDFSGYRILCVDDDEINHIAYKVKLSDTCCEVDHALNGWLALEHMKNKKYDLVLMDYDMPAGTGVEIAEKAKTLIGMNCPPIVCVSAYDYETIVRKNPNFESVCDGYLEKVTDRGALLKCVGKHLGIKANSARKYEFSHEICNSRYSCLNVQEFCRAYSGDASSGRTLLEYFVNAGKEFPAKIDNALATNDRRSVVHLLHRIKGLASNVGAGPLAKEAQIQMREVEDGQIDIALHQSKINLNKLENLVHQTVEEAILLSMELDKDIRGRNDIDHESALDEIHSLLEVNSAEILIKLPDLVNSCLFQGDEVTRECLDDVMSAVRDGKLDDARTRIRRLKGDRHAAGR